MAVRPQAAGSLALQEPRSTIPLSEPTLLLQAQAAMLRTPGSPMRHRLEGEAETVDRRMEVRSLQRIPAGTRRLVSSTAALRIISQSVAMVAGVGSVRL